MGRFIVNETFTDEETGTEYAQGAIYDTETLGHEKLAQWAAEDKIRNPDEDIDPDNNDDDDLDDTIENMKAKHEDDDDDDDDEKDEPA